MSEVVEARESGIHGMGVFALVSIDEGALIGRYTGSPTAVDGTHVLWIQEDDETWRGVDGTGVLRYLNHSRTPNVEFDGAELSALRPIQPGEELVFHYGDDWADIP